MAFALANACAGEPVLVRRPDAADLDYFLVPWQSADGIHLIVQVSAKTGSMLGAAQLDRPVLQMVMSDSEALRIAKLESGRPITDKPILMWRPCRESSSPYQPFYRIRTQDGDRFIGSDGSIHPALTPFEKGG